MWRLKAPVWFNTLTYPCERGVGTFPVRSWFWRYRSNLVLPLPKIAPKSTIRSSGKAMVQNMLLLLRYQLLKCPLIMV